uniref:Uncharacterized protein n=1 Tax=Glossina brevipalpis TaxID=37001 RepID=A0A1A9WVL9_9MUSC
MLSVLYLNDRQSVNILLILFLTNEAGWSLVSVSVVIDWLILTVVIVCRFGLVKLMIWQLTTVTTTTATTITSQKISSIFFSSFRDILVVVVVEFEKQCCSFRNVDKYLPNLNLLKLRLYTYGHGQEVKTLLHGAGEILTLIKGIQVSDDVDDIFT